MRIRFLLAVFILLTSSTSYAEIDSVQKDTEELMQYLEANTAFYAIRQGFLLRVKEMREADQDKGRMTEEQLAKEEEDYKKVQEIVNRELTWDKVKPTFVKVYEDVFTEAEREALLEFFRSPAGIAFRNKRQELTLKLMEAGQKSFILILPALEQLTETSSSPPPPPPPLPPR